MADFLLAVSDGYNIEDVEYVWDPRPPIPVNALEGLTMSQFSLIDIRVGNATMKTVYGAYVVQLHHRRQLLVLSSSLVSSRRFSRAALNLHTLFLPSMLNDADNGLALMRCQHVSVVVLLGYISTLTAS